MVEALRIAWYERSLGLRVANLAIPAVATLFAIALAYRSPNPTLTGPFAVALIAGAAIWMLTTARTHLALAALMLYLGLVDGVIKLMTNSSSATLGRDALLFAIVIGVLIKRVSSKERFSSPPLTGWILVFVAVVLVQIFNPGDISFKHSLASTRPHIEFVPLFFLGHSIMRSRKRLKAFLVLLMAVAAINGVVSLVQFSMSPSQLASWGPGYAARINGTGGISGRKFVDNSGKVRVRPFALGSDEGFGGAVGALAAPGVLALLALGGSPRLKIAAGVLSVGVVLAVVTSQGRVDIVGSVVAIIAFMVLTVSSRRVARLLGRFGIGMAIAYVAILVLASHTNSHLFDRYKSISPGKVLSTGYSYRSGTNLQVLPSEIAKFPLGAGIGKTGPAAGSAGASGNYGLDAESEPTYMVVELGIPGLLVMLGFQLRLLRLSLGVRRQTDLELRLLLAALAAPLFALFIDGWDASTTASTPLSPYLWFVGGVLSYWLITARKGEERPLVAS